jgi:hypothetical protein
VKGFLAENDLVGGEHEYDRSRIAPKRELGACGNRRSGIAAHRLEHDRSVDLHVLRLRARRSGIYWRS